ncbi:hydroxyacid dehydrogenase [Acetobacteraceae bacterium]|nr:hydroxyacid dehydrogenase [Acetobacteraceae bacterium]
MRNTQSDPTRWTTEEKGELILYTTEDGKAAIELHAHKGTVWLSQSEMATLFERGLPTINEHIKAIYAEGECLEEATLRNFRIVQNEGGRAVEREIAFYALEMILAVGYRVRSPRGTQFRRWATTVLKEYLIKGFALDDVRLKQEKMPDYFDELLERLRDIRASEKRFYQKIRDIYATASDYDKDLESARLFFKTVQNKMLYAVTGKTASELILERADAQKPNMGLTSWKGSIVRKGDVDTAKNYLQEQEISELNQIVTMYLDYAEDQARRRKSTSMAEFADKLDKFLAFNERPVLQGAGTRSAAQAKTVSSERYATFDARRKAIEKEEAEKAHLEELQQELKKAEQKAKRK